MNVKTALQLIELIDCGPGWRLEAEDHTHRYQDVIKVTVHVNAIATEREHWATECDGYCNADETLDVRASFHVFVGRCNNDVDLYRCVFDNAVVPVLLHEAREMFRIKPTGWAPFHPHRRDGMERWGEPERDQAYGLA